MLRGPLDWAYRRFGAAYPRLALAVVLVLSPLVAVGGVWLLDLYVDLDDGRFWRIFAIAVGLSAVEVAGAAFALSRLLRPAEAWLQGERTVETAARAWAALAGLSRDFLIFGRFVPVVLTVVPVPVYVTAELDEGWWPALPILVAGTSVVLLYGVFLRFFGFELVARPVLEDISCDLPDGPQVARVTVPLRWRMMAALPTINIITGVVTVGFASGRDAGLDQLGLGVLVTLAVSFTVSLELSLLLLRSILDPIDDLQRGTQAVAAGDLGVRVPVVGTDETGRLAGSFNRMVAGLEERERLREAFGAFVDPHLAERVLEEGTHLEGEELEVSVMFLDIRNFTAFAEQATATEVLARLNEFYALVVPVLVEHGGHANKFAGDGLLAVFGAPDRMLDHADRAVRAALQLSRCVRERYGEELRIGIGVNSGVVVAGTVGGGGRVEFTVIGDAVNIAARVEELTRETGDDVLVTEATRSLLHEDHGGFAARGAVPLKGRRDEVVLHAPLAALPAGPGAGR